LGIPPDDAGANDAIHDIAKKTAVDLLWVEKGLTIDPMTLKEATKNNPKAITVSVHPDDIAQNVNVSSRYLRSIPVYDVHFTHREVNIEDLKRAGARRVLRTWFTYDEKIHRPMTLGEGDRERLGGILGFVGGYEADRAAAMKRLADSGLGVRIWGVGRWRKVTGTSPRLRIENMPLWDADYAKAVCAFDINLGFLRKLNRDQHTTRSFEIPACGGFLLAERTEEHLELYCEGKEAEFFSSSEELIDKARFYIEHPDVRGQIARAGLARCIRNGADNQTRLKEMINLALKDRC